MTTALDAAPAYASRAYAAALGHIGEAVRMERSGTWLIRRPVAGGGTDLAGPYPLLHCHDWASLGQDLSDDRIDLTVTAVTDPFTDPGAAALSAVFPDLVRPWKDHHVVDLADPHSAVSSHHRRNVDRAQVAVDRVDAPSAHLALATLYRHLADRHHITGPAAFPAASLRAQLMVPGAQAWLATDPCGIPAGIAIAYVDGPDAWYHLGAASEDGYRRGAMFALFWQMLADLAAAGCDRVDLGAGAGTADPTAGLDRFKRGWASHQLPTHLVGRILDREATARLAADGHGDVTWFPPYRGGQQ